MFLETRLTVVHLIPDMPSSKRPQSDENTYFSFIDNSIPTQSSKFHTPRDRNEEVKNQENVRKQSTERAKQIHQAAANLLSNKCLRASRQLVMKVCMVLWKSYSVFAISSCQLSATVSRMLGQHGQTIDNIRARQPSLANKWAIEVMGELLAREGKKLAEYLRPAQDSEISDYPHAVVVNATITAGWFRD